MKLRLPRRLAKARQRQVRTWVDQKGRHWRDLDETMALEPAPQVGRWSVLTVAPRMEAAAAEALRDAGYVAWFPQTTETVVSHAHRTRTKVNRPLFPRYLFAAPGEVAERRSWPDRGAARLIATKAYAGETLADWMRAPEAIGMTDCDHVLRIVAEAGQGLLDELSRRQGLGEFEQAQKARPFGKGSRVRVADGPFRGLDGIVDRLAKDRVEVLLTFFGQTTRVRLEECQVVEAAA